MEVSRDKVEALAKRLEQSGFYVPGIDEVAAGWGSTLQVTHIESVSRADLVIAGSGEWEQKKFERRRLISIQGVGSFYFAAPEDLVLSKLQWGKQSQSEKQWRDVLGVLKVQGNTLDLNYLRHWAVQLGIADDFDRALTESGL